MSKQVYKNFIFLFIVQFSNYVLPFLVIPLLTRALGVEGFGKYAFYLGIANLLLVFVRFGFEFSATKEISIQSDNLIKVGEIVGAVLQIKIILLLITAIIYLLFITMIKPDVKNSALFLGGFLLLVGQTLLPVWYFQGMQQMKFVTFYAVITKVCYVGLLFLLIRNDQDYALAVIVYGASFFVAGFVSMLHMCKTVPVKFRFDLNNIKPTFFNALPFFTSRIFVTAYTSSLIPIIGMIGSPAQVAIYAASEKLYLAVQSVMSPLASALYPHMAKKKDIRLFKKIFFIAMCCVLIGGTLTYFIAPYLIEFLFGQAFKESADIFNIHIIALIFVLPSLLLGYPLLAALGFSKEANGSVIIGAIVFFLLALIIYFSGIVATEYFVWAVVAAELTVFTLRIYFSAVRVFIPPKKSINKEIL